MNGYLRDLISEAIVAAFERTYAKHGASYDPDTCYEAADEVVADEAVNRLRDVRGALNIACADLEVARAQTDALREALVEARLWVESVVKEASEYDTESQTFIAGNEMLDQIDADLAAAAGTGQADQ